MKGEGGLTILKQEILLVAPYETNLKSLVDTYVIHPSLVIP